MIRAIDLRLVYPTNGFQAVNPVTFGVRKGSVLGLLGPNGAGKSSTFSMLSMERARTSGSAELLGQYVQDLSMTKQGNLLGMCP